MSSSKKAKSRLRLAKRYSKLYISLVELAEFLKDEDEEFSGLLKAQLEDGDLLVIADSKRLTIKSSGD